MPQHTPQPTQTVSPPTYSPQPPVPLPLLPYLPIDIPPSRRFVPSQPALTEKSTLSTTPSPPAPTAPQRPSCVSPACPLLPPPRKGIDDYFARAREMDTGPKRAILTSCFASTSALRLQRLNHLRVAVLRGHVERRPSVLRRRRASRSAPPSAILPRPSGLPTPPHGEYRTQGRYLALTAVTYHGACLASSRRLTDSGAYSLCCSSLGAEAPS
jgi:hypothetical protein